jgi:hypothetical protein
MIFENWLRFNNCFALKNIKDVLEYITEILINAMSNI